MNRFNVFVEVGDGESLPTVRALCALIVVHLPDMPRQVGHGKLLLTVRARLLNLEKKLLLIRSVVYLEPTLSCVSLTCLEKLSTEISFLQSGQLVFSPKWMLCT